MKKFIYLFAIILFLSSSKLTAQQADDYKHTTDSLFIHLDKIGVNTDVLYDGVFTSAALNNF